MISRGDTDELTGTMKLDDEQSSRARACVFVFWPGGAATYELPVQGTLVIGRAPTCTIRIDHASVSRQHAAIHVGDGVYVEDLGSSNGTKVSGRRLDAKRRQPLPQGALVEVGLATAIVQASAVLPTPGLGAGPAAEAGTTTPTMDRLEQLVALVAPARISVILLGETGVGKEVTAERIHRLSPRASGPLVRLNCAALPEPILESERFGHERGAFTGAHSRKIGLIEAADGGTLFLDEVGELPLTIQAKLLRVLESREVTPVGGLTGKSVDVRFIAATNGDLDTLVASGAFRSDLYYRLQGITLRIPPLRDRRAEIPGLVRAFVAQFSRAAGQPEPSVSTAALQRLGAADWPGNIRELRNVIERAVVLSAGRTIDLPHLEEMPAPRELAPESAPASSLPRPPSGDLGSRPFGQSAAPRADLSSRPFGQSAAPRADLSSRPFGQSAAPRADLSSRPFGQSAAPRADLSSRPFGQSAAPRADLSSRPFGQSAAPRADLSSRPFGQSAAPRADLSSRPFGQSAAPRADLRSEVEALERQRIIDALQESGGNQTEAAKLLGISRRMMLGRLDAYGLPRPRKR